MPAITKKILLLNQQSKVPSICHFYQQPGKLMDQWYLVVIFKEIFLPGILNPIRLKYSESMREESEDCFGLMRSTC